MNSLNAQKIHYTDKYEEIKFVLEATLLNKKINLKQLRDNSN